MTLLVYRALWQLKRIGLNAVIYNRFKLCFLAGKISLGTLTHTSSYTWGSEKGSGGPDILEPLCHHTLFQDYTQAENESEYMYIWKK